MAQRVRGIDEIVQVAGSFRADRKLAKGTLDVGELMLPAEFDQDGDRLAVTQSFGLRMSPHPASEGSEAAPVLEVLATYRIVYRLDNAAAAPVPVLLQFASVNARFNLTAYWREYLHTCCCRIGVPPMVVPPFNAAAAIDALKGLSVGSESASSS
ncbi:MAG: hypothetical protein ACKVZJ_14835 [Phycisphaerales bacterium]